MIIFVIYEVTLLFVGALFCLCGLKVYRAVQCVLCGILFGLIGVAIVRITGNDELYSLITILVPLGALIGYKCYNMTLYLTAAIGSFIAVFSYYWHQALYIASFGTGTILNMNRLKREGLASNLGVVDLLDNAFEMVDSEIDFISYVLREAADILKRGFIIALVVSVVAGILAKWFGDYVIIVVTSLLGTMLLAKLIENFAMMNSQVYVIVCLVIAVVSVIHQLTKRKKKK